MDLRTQNKFFPVTLAALMAAALMAVGCSIGSTGSTSTTTAAETGPSFVVGTDAPVASVVSFSVPIESATASDDSGNTVSLVSGTPTVDFARYNGLQTLLDMNDVAAGSYSNVSITLGSATIGYLQAEGSGQPTIATMAAT